MKDIKELKLDKSNWRLVKLGDVVSEIRKTTKDPVADGLENVVGLEHITPEDIHLRKAEPISSETTFTKTFEKGDVLFGRRRAYLKKAAQAPFSGICSGDITVMRVRKELREDLLPFVINNDLFFDYAIKHSAGGLSPRVKWKDLANYEFLLPPKEEQARLAELLWSLDEVIEREREVLDSIRLAYSTVIQKELISDTGEKTHLANLGEVIRGVGYKPKDLLSEHSENSCILLRSNNISHAKLNFEDINIIPDRLVKHDQLLQKGDFAICMSNGSKELVGKCAEFKGLDSKVTIGSFCAGFRPKDIESGSLLNHLFNSESYRYTIKRILTGSAINNLKPSDIEGMYFKLNSDSEIIDKLDKLFSGIDMLEEKISISQSLQKSLINETFG